MPKYPATAHRLHRLHHLESDSVSVATHHSAAHVRVGGESYQLRRYLMLHKTKGWWVTESGGCAMAIDIGTRFLDWPLNAYGDRRAASWIVDHGVTDPITGDPYTIEEAQQMVRDARAELESM